MDDHATDREPPFDWSGFNADSLIAVGPPPAHLDWDTPPAREKPERADQPRTILRLTFPQNRAIMAPLRSSRGRPPSLQPTGATDGPLPNTPYLQERVA